MSELFVGDAMDWLKLLPADSVHSWITSPPYYGLRDYGVAGQIGLEQTPRAYLGRLVAIFEEAKRTLHPTGTLWLNMGDSYAATGKSGGGRQGAAWEGRGPAPMGPRGGRWSPAPNGWKPKDLLGMPWRLAFALQEAGWYLRSDIIWAKPNAMPESVRDRPSKSHEYLFLLTKEPRYFYDGEAVRRARRPDAKPVRNDQARDWQGVPLYQSNLGGRTQEPKKVGSVGTHEGGAALRSVWTIPVGRYKGAHFATFPEKLVKPCVLAGTSEKGCCPKCLNPWVRIIERKREPTRPGLNSKVLNPAANALGHRIHHPEVIGNRDPQRHTTITTTAGWKPTCSCGLDPIPCTVGDMFAGSGTTLAVAKQLGRSYLGCELKEEYLALIRQRLDSVTPELKFSGNLPAESKKTVAELRETG